MLNINKFKYYNIPVPMQNMFDHFKSLDITLDVDDDIAFSSCAANNPDLNQHFSEAEFRRVVKQLKNIKACGPDFVLNEFIESILDVFLPEYIKLFNHILDTGNIPGNLTIGEIIPIYKNKGERNLPENYGGITILGCFGTFLQHLLMIVSRALSRPTI